ncbi:MAG: hypothetical protein JNJ45_04030 [Chthonomonas sp.]|nr:hypothetical protein [Chthonomonas sp.]
MVSVLIALSLAEPALIARVDDKDLTESSGVAASVFAPQEFWTHNDSGDKARLFRFNLKGEITARVMVDAKAHDWEDMEIVRRGGSSTVYVADIGDNSRRRKSVTIIAFPEPRGSGDVAKPTLYELTYPDGPRDAESFAVDPKTGAFYIVEKVNGPSGVYALDKPKPGENKLRRVGAITTSSIVPMSKLTTGASFSPDGKHVVVRGYLGAYLFAVPDKDRAWWKSTGSRLDLRPERQGEAICFSRDSRWLYTTSEGRPCEVSRVQVP